MSPTIDRTASVSEVSNRGISAILSDAETGQGTIVERHGHPVAAIVGMRRLAELEELEADLRSAALVLTRLATDNGERTALDDVIASFGFDPTELDAELDAEPGHG